MTDDGNRGFERGKRARRVHEVMSGGFAAASLQGNQ